MLSGCSCGAEEAPAPAQETCPWAHREVVTWLLEGVSGGSSSVTLCGTHPPGVLGQHQGKPASILLHRSCLPFSRIGVLAEVACFIRAGS